MGTRNLTIVISGGTHKIAQYGQRDGYPDGQGVTALEFCRLHLATQEGRESFANIFQRVRFISKDEDAAICDAWTGNDADFFEKYPMLSRDHGAGILNRIAEMKPGTYALLRDSYAFAGNSLSNEWTYVIDLDLGTFEVFEGFNTKFPPVAGERFAAVPPYTSYDGTVYYPVRLVKKWDLHGLPTKAEFLAALKDADEDAAEE